MLRTTRRHLLTYLAAFFLPALATAGGYPSDSLSSGADAPEGIISPAAFVHDLPRFAKRLGVERRFGYILPSHRFLTGENNVGEPIESFSSTHLKYAFGFSEKSNSNQIYPGVYQGIGIAYYDFGEPEQLGNPVAIYLFQGARIAKFSSRFSLNYEWNFGLSGGWKPYDSETNGMNFVIGSKYNAYLNVDCYAQWNLSPHVDLNSGVALTHFSNGNTKFPNAGLNLAGWSLGVTYRFDAKQQPDDQLSRATRRMLRHTFPRHVSYDVLLFGSWRSKGVYFGEEAIASPHTYTVLGFNFAPMYNFGYRFRAGISLDGVYDGSANIYTEDYIQGTQPRLFTPSIDRQLALGLSLRTEYVMPYFTVGAGMGANILHKGGDMKGVYQLLSLKIEVTRDSFLHIGYNIRDFHEPNFLMFGIGYRFANRYPYCHR